MFDVVCSPSAGPPGSFVVGYFCLLLLPKWNLVDNAVNDLNFKLNNLLAYFLHCNSSTLSVLFQSYCMNAYGCQIWSYNNIYINKYYTAWRKAIRRI